VLNAGQEIGDTVGAAVVGTNGAEQMQTYYELAKWNDGHWLNIPVVVVGAGVGSENGEYEPTYPLDTRPEDDPVIVKAPSQLNES
jgi:hypothetical protein